MEEEKIKTASRIEKLKETKGEQFIREIVLLTSSIISLIFGVIAFLVLTGIVRFILNAYDLIVLAILSFSGIYGGYILTNQKKTEKMERYFPDFVRDLAESKRSGMTFTKAIIMASKGNYGELTPEIQKMARQISWGASVNEALISFAKRVNTPLINRIVSIIVEATKGGGSTSDVLEAASRDATEMKILQTERKTNMFSYVMIVYIGAFAFLAIILILCSQFIPSLSKGSYNLPGMSGGISEEDAVKLFSLATLIQAIGSGIVAGVFETGRLSDGIKHMFLLTLVTWLFFRSFIGVPF